MRRGVGAVKKAADREQIVMIREMRREGRKYENEQTLLVRPSRAGVAGIYNIALRESMMSVGHRLLRIHTMHHPRVIRTMTTYPIFGNLASSTGLGASDQDVTLSATA